MLRTILERVSRNVVLERRMPKELGGLRLFVSPDASLKFWRRDLWKTDDFVLRAALALVRPGDVVWDVGANVGLFAFAAAGLSGAEGRVLAIEPDPWLSGLLNRSAAVNGKSGCVVEILQAAVGERVGEVMLNIAARGRATNFVAGHVPSTQTGGVRAAVRVNGTTLDALLAGRAAPTLLKIDVEGAEHAVLRGARQVLGAVRPRILCEVSQESREEVTDILRGAGYILYDAARPWPDAGPIAGCAWNTIAVPSGGGR